MAAVSPAVLNARAVTGRAGSFIPLLGSWYLHLIHELQRSIPGQDRLGVKPFLS